MVIQSKANTHTQTIRMEYSPVSNPFFSWFILKMILLSTWYLLDFPEAAHTQRMPEFRIGTRRTTAWTKFWGIDFEYYENVKEHHKCSSNHETHQIGSLNKWMNEWEAHHHLGNNRMFIIQCNICEQKKSVKICEKWKHRIFLFTEPFSYMGMTWMD